MCVQYLTMFLLFVHLDNSVSADLTKFLLFCALAVSHTNRMLERSKENFDEAGLVPSKQKSPRKALAQPIKDKN